MFSVAKAKRQQQMFYLRESEAPAANVLSVRKRSGSNKCFLRESEAAAIKAPSRNGSQPLVMVISFYLIGIIFNTF